MEGNDHKVSLLPDEFAEMVVRIREVEEALGSASPRAVSTGEMMNRVNLAKSLVAARDLEPGDVIDRAAVDIKSPGRGLQPNALDRLVGRTANRGLRAGDFFYATDLSDAVSKGRDYVFRRPWGLPVRYHDVETLTADCTPDFLEFHFSYKDLEIDPATVLPDRLPMGYACHAPDLFAGDFILNLASEDDAHWERSIAELQRVIDLTRSLRPFFTTDVDPVVISSVGGFTTDRHVPLDELPDMYARVAAGLDRVDDAGVRLSCQTLPPFPWYMGGQLYCNLFVRASDTAEFATRYGRRLCLDVSHTKLATTFLGQPFCRGGRAARAAQRPPAPRRLRRGRRRGRAGRRRRDRLAGAGPPARRARARGRLHPGDLAGPRQQRRGLLAGAGAARAVVLTGPDAPPTALWVVPVGDVAGVARHVLDVVEVGVPGYRLVVLLPARAARRAAARGGRRGGDGARSGPSTASASRWRRCGTPWARCARRSPTRTCRGPTSSPPSPPSAPPPRWSPPSTASRSTTSSTTAPCGGPGSRRWRTPHGCDARMPSSPSPTRPPARCGPSGTPRGRPRCG